MGYITSSADRRIQNKVKPEEKDAVCGPAAKQA